MNCLNGKLIDKWNNTLRHNTNLWYYSKKKLPIDVKIIVNFWAMQLLFSSTFWKKIVDIFGKATEPSVNNLIKTALVQTLRKNWPQSGSSALTYERTQWQHQYLDSKMLLQWATIVVGSFSSVSSEINRYFPSNKMELGLLVVK